MKKFIISLLTCFLILPNVSHALEIDNLYSKNVLVYNLDENKILYDKNIDDKISIASLTKIMTTLVAIENIEDLNEKVKITTKMLEGIPYDASVAGLKVGDVVTYKDLLYASMIPSGADATQSLADSLTGSISNFVSMMNKKAENIGLKNTHFVNTTGLDEKNHYSSLEDILTLIKYALNNKTFKKVFETKSYTTTNNIKLKSTLNGYNKGLNYDLSYVKGSKTGFTDDAGLCLLTLSNIDDTNIITITTDAPYTYGNFKNIIDLNNIKTSLNENYTKVELIKENELLTTLKTKYAKQKNIEIKSSKIISRYIENPYDEKQLKIEYNGKEIISYKTKVGSKLGEIKISYKDEIVDVIEVKLEQELNFSLWEYIKDNIITIIIIVVVFITLVLILKPKKKKKKKELNYLQILRKN